MYLDVRWTFHTPFALDVFSRPWCNPRRGSQAEVMSETRAIVPVPEEADAIPYWALAAARNELYAREYGYDFRMCARADCAPRALPYASNASNSSPCVRSV